MAEIAASDSLRAASASSAASCRLACSPSAPDSAAVNSLDLRLGGDEFASGLVDFGGDLQGARLAVGAAADPPGADEVAVERDRAQVRAAPRPASRAAARSSTTATSASIAVIAPCSRAGASIRSRAQRAPSGSGPVCGRDPAGQSPSTIAARPPSASLRARTADAGGGEVVGGHRVGRRAQHRGQRHLVADAHLDQLGDRAEKSCAAAVLHQPRRAVLAFQADRERVDAGPQRGDLALGGPLGGLQLGHPLVGQPQRGDRPVVLLVEADLALVELADPALHGLELGLGLLGAGGGLLDGAGQPRHPVVDRLDAGPHGLDLAGQARQAFAPVGLGPHGGHVGAFGLGRRAFLVGQLGAGGFAAGSSPAASSASSCCSRAATSSASASSASGSGPVLAVGSVSRYCARSLAMRTVALTRSASAESRNQVCWAASVRSDSVATAASWAASCLGGHRQPCGGLVVLAAQRGLGVVGALELGAAHRPGRRRPAAAARRAGRPGWSAARRATSAWRPSGLSWRRSSVVRSVSRARLADIASSLRSAFSLRLRCLSTPAASSMKARRSSGRDSQDLRRAGPGRR